MPESSEVLAKFFGDESFPVEWESEEEKQLFWFFDDNEFPTLIKLIPDGGDTITLNLLSTIRPIDAYLNFTMNRTCGPQNMPYIGYNFKFIRAN